LVEQQENTSPIIPSHGLEKAIQQLKPSHKEEQLSWGTLEEGKQRENKGEERERTKPW
jgi:hypothetical protein